MSYRNFREEVEDMPHAGYSTDGYVWRIEAAEIAARADARIAELDRECSQWRDELRIFRETENARIAELEQAVTVRDTEIARLETDLELARRDGERYRYVRRKGAWIHHDLRKLGSIGPVFVTVEYGRGEALDTERLDAAIDAAIDDGCQKVSEMLEARAGNGGGA